MSDNSDREVWLMIDHCVAHHSLVDCAHRVQPGVVHAWTTSLNQETKTSGLNKNHLLPNVKKTHALVDQGMWSKDTQFSHRSILLAWKSSILSLGRITWRPAGKCGRRVSKVPRLSINPCNPNQDTGLSWSWQVSATLSLFALGCFSVHCFPTILPHGIFNSTSWGRDNKEVVEQQVAVVEMAGEAEVDLVNIADIGEWRSTPLCACLARASRLREDIPVDRLLFWLLPPFV